MVIDMEAFKKRKKIKRGNVDFINPYDVNVSFNGIELQQKLNEMESSYQQLEDEGFVYDTD